MLGEFQKFGRLLFETGMISSHGGNMSVRVGNKLWITRRNSMLSDLKEGDIVQVSLDNANSDLASRELPVHLAIYKEDFCNAVIHAHPRYAVALSLLMDTIVPIDSEGAYILKEVPVLAVEESIGSQEVAAKIPALLKRYSVVMVKGHGSFAVGSNLEDAYRLTSCLEFSSNILWLAEIYRSAGVDRDEINR